MQISNTLRASLAVLGLGFIILGLFLNFQLYTSLAPDGQTVYKGSYALVGILLDLSKVTLLILGVILLGNGAYTSGLISLIFYAVLSGISFSAGWGFSLIVSEKYESEQAKSSYEYANYSNQLQQANAAKSQYAAFSSLDVTALNAKLGLLNNELSQHQTKLAACPPNYFKNCIDPTNAKINAVKAEIMPIESQIAAYSKYLAASNVASESLNSIAALDSGKIANVSNIHPLFNGMAVIFGTTPVIAKYRFTFLSFLMVELLGALLYMLSVILKRKNDFTISELLNMQHQYNTVKKQLTAINVPALNVSGDDAKKYQRAY